MRVAVSALVAAGAAAAAQAASPTLHSTWGNGVRDTVRCSTRADVVNADHDDRVAAACGTVLRQIADDATTAAGPQHATVAEPHVLAVGDTAVAAYQVARFADGGAARIGVAVTRDGGRRWRSSLLPRARGFARASDPVVAFDPVRATWIVALVAETPGGASGLLVSRSTDATRWTAPEVVARDDAFRFDKEWIACDAGAASPFRGRCYLAYNDVVDETIVLRTSDDGGVTWTVPVPVAPAARGQIGAIPLVRPDGSVLVVWLRSGRAQRSARSIDGGVSFSPPGTLARVVRSRLPGVRAPEIPSAAIGPDGTAVVAWHGCVAAPCTRNGIVASTSADGVSWTAPRRIAGASGTAFLPTVAVSPEDGTTAATFYALGPAGIDAYLARSTRGGGWTTPSRLTARAFEPAWVARSTLGAMLGDYFGLTWVAGRPLAVLVLAGAPSGRTLRQPLFATLRVA